MNHFTAVRTVAVPVTDQDKALDFYVGTLGFELELDAPLPQLGGRWLVVALPGSGSSIALIPATEEFPAGTDTGIRLATDDAATAHAALTSKGVSTDELLAWPGIPPMFACYDSDHNKLFVVQE